MTFFSTVRVKTTFRNWPGQRALSVLGKVALRWIVPVVVSMALSTNVRTPGMGLSFSLTTAPVLISPWAMYFLIRGKFCSGTEKET